MKIPTLLEPLAAAAETHALYESSGVAPHAARMASEGDALAFGSRTTGATYAALVGALRPGGPPPWPEYDILFEAPGCEPWPLNMVGWKPVYLWLCWVDMWRGPSTAALELAVRSADPYYTNAVRFAEGTVTGLVGKGVIKVARCSKGLLPCRERSYHADTRWDPGPGWREYFDALK